MLLSKCAVCNSKQLKFMKYQEVGRLLSNLSLKTPLCKTPVIGNILFYGNRINEITSMFFISRI